jgi:hypothetical protein
MSNENQAATLSPEEQRLRGAEAKPEVIPEEPVLDAPKAEVKADDKEADSAPEGETSDDDAPRKPRRNDLKYWKQRAREAEEREASLVRQTREEPKATVKTEAPQGKPKLEDFASFDDFQEALIDYKADQKWEAKQREAVEKQTKTVQQRYEAELRSKFLESADKARDKYDDFDEVISSPTLKVTQQVAMLVGETDDPGEVSYYLARNPDEAKRLNSLPPARAAVELGKIEAKIASKPVSVTKAPPPPSTARGKSGVSKPNNAYTADEWYAKRMAEFKRKT